MAGFLFGAGTGDTATSLKRKRELIEELQNQIMGTTPKTTAEGIAAVIKGAATGIGKYRADKVEGEKTGAASSIYNKIMGDYSSKFPAPEAAGQVSATSPVNSSQRAPVNISGDKAGFVSSLLPAAQEAAARTGVDPRIIVAQAALESGWGKSAPGNNLFGIKSHGQSGGNSLMTSEVVDGKTVRQRDNFRAYGSPAESVNGYADFITENPRYKGMRSAKGLDAQIDELGRSGYATDPEYASKIRSIAQGIELPAEVASVDPQAAFGAVLADPSQIAPEDAQRLQAMRGPTGGNTPYSGPGAKIDTPMPVYDTNGLHMPQQGGSLTDEVAQFQQSPEYAAQFPGQQPQQAMPQPVRQQPMQQMNPALAQSQSQQYAQSVNNATGGNQPQQQQQQQPQPMPQAVQPNGIDPRILQALSDPFLPEEQRSALQILAKQQMEQSDPLRQLQLQEQQLKLRAMQNPQPEYDFINGKDGSVFRADKRAGTMEQLYGGKPDQPADVQEYEYYVQSEKAAGRQPLGPLEYQQALRRSGANSTSVNIDQKAEGAFDKKLAEKQAETFDVMASEGINSRADLGVINELDTLLQGQGGTLTGLSGTLAKYGIGGEGVDDLQAAQALINKLIPSQRAPGSGSMSDRDVEMFTRSLPSLWNSPGGNAKIVNVMRGLATYKQQQGEIADQVITGDMSRQEARRALRDLPNPLADMKPKEEGTATPSQNPSQTSTQPISEQDYLALPSGAEFTAPDGTRRRKP